ncbi:hypothetical protein [Moraxella cuniculi]|uniref:Uncharacterized protein n=1 Tax=Moraxella cuniculi TaxID=34061 RepID=A0A3S4UTY1_9GAMM|nr:hypothetical protein [Moraxella cuniculi]VEG12930.1 Uncharacterised protein [Moraxella cuniculi]
MESDGVWSYLYHESGLRNPKLTGRQRRHIQALKDAGAVSYEEIEKKFNACQGNKVCEKEVEKEWCKQSEITRQIERDLVVKGILTWEDFDKFEGGIGTATPHLSAIQNKKHSLAQSEVFSWNQPDHIARTEALRRDGGVTPGSTEDLLMQAGAGTVGAVAAGRGKVTVSSNAGNSSQNVSISPIRLHDNSSSKTWSSPAGLNYGQGSREGNRVKHVLEHAQPNSNKPNHTVFNVQRNQILSLVDQAWVRRGNPLPSDPGVYVIPMGKVVGTRGETSIRIVVKPGTNQVITAYPTP